MPNEISVIFHYGSNYSYHFIIKELANEFEGQFECLAENIMIIKIDKDRNESIVTISYKIKFIDSARFMMSSLSNLVDNLAEGIHKTKCKGCASFLEHKCINDNLINYNCLFFNQKLLKQG